MKRSGLAILATLVCACYSPPQTTPVPAPRKAIVVERWQPGFLLWLVNPGSAASKCQRGAVATTRGVTTGDVILGLITWGLFTPTHSGAVCADSLLAPESVPKESELDRVLLPAASIGDSVVTCEAPDCATQWQRAQLWLANHSRWKIQTATDVLIDTFNPVSGGGASEITYGFRVLREPLPAGRYRMRVEAVCGTERSGLGREFPCSPTASQVRRAFLYYVVTGNDLLAGVAGLEGIR